MAAKYLTTKPTAEELTVLLQPQKTYIKLAVDIRLGRVAGGGVWHADAEKVLIERGSTQEDIWGGDWIPDEGKVEYYSMINISSERGNRGQEIQIPDVRKAFEAIVRRLFED